MKIGLLQGDPLARAAMVAQLRVAGRPVAWSEATVEKAMATSLVQPPDVVLLVPPLFGGTAADATRAIREKLRCPVLLVHPGLGDQFTDVYAAIDAGAVSLGSTSVAAIIAKLDALPRKKPTSPSTPLPSVPVPLIAIGASTGGPQCLADILGKLPRDLRGALLIVQHMDAEFTSGLADWLAARTNFPVRLAVEGETPIAGEARLATGHEHLVLRRTGTVHYSATPHETPFRPSVDVLFDSLAQPSVRPGLATLLTGMGKDGAAGLLRLREAGWHTIAQDEKSCVVYGMPKAAAKLNAAVQILSPPRIAQAIVSFCARAA